MLYASFENALQRGTIMGIRTNRQSHWLERLFLGALICGVAGFTGAVTAAAFGLPVIFQIAFITGVTAMLAIFAIGIAGIASLALQW